MPKVVDVDQRRGELADAAARVIARCGIDGTSLREVAAEAGWTTGALVHYFADKRELLAFTLRTSLDRRRSRHADRDHLPPVDALRATLAEALPTTPDARLHWTVTLAFAGLASSDPDLADIQRDAYRRFRSNVIGLLRCIDDMGGDDTNAIDDPADDDSSGDARSDEAERLIALANGISLQAIFDPARWTPRRQLAALDHGIALGIGTGVGAGIGGARW